MLDCLNNGLKIHRYQIIMVKYLIEQFNSLPTTRNIPLYSFAYWQPPPPFILEVCV